MTDRYAVVGNPVAHSLSPQVHREFARQTGQDIAYTAILAPLNGFKAAVLRFRDDGGKGVNVTLPFKREAWDLAADLRGDALECEAVNTMDFRDGRIVGYNTDGIGLVADLERNLGFPIRGRRVLLMGAGGASYGVMHSIFNAAPESLVVANRTPDKADSLIAHFKRSEKYALRDVSAKPYQELAGSRFDLVINATSAGLNDEMPPLPPGVFTEGALAYDMVYGRHTPFMRFASEQGARTSDGMGMLIEQAAESFLIWRGVRPQTAPVIAMLKGVNSG